MPEHIDTSLEMIQPPEGGIFLPQRQAIMSFVREPQLPFPEKEVERRPVFTLPSDGLLPEPTHKDDLLRRRTEQFINDHSGLIGGYRAVKVIQSSFFDQRQYFDNRSLKLAEESSRSYLNTTAKPDTSLVLIDAQTGPSRSARWQLTLTNALGRCVYQLVMADNLLGAQATQFDKQGRASSAEVLDQTACRQMSGLVQSILISDTMREAATEQRKKLVEVVTKKVIKIEVPHKIEMTCERRLSINGFKPVDVYRSPLSEDINERAARNAVVQEQAIQRAIGSGVMRTYVKPEVYDQPSLLPIQEYDFEKITEIYLNVSGCQDTLNAAIQDYLQFRKLYIKSVQKGGDSNLSCLERLDKHQALTRFKQLTIKTVLDKQIDLFPRGSYKVGNKIYRFGDYGLHVASIDPKPLTEYRTLVPKTKLVYKQAGIEHWIDYGMMLLEQVELNAL